MSYFSTDYFSADYFSTDYWGSTPSGFNGQIATTVNLVRPRSLGDVGYWSTNYWSQNHWSNNYWGDQYLEPFFTGTFEAATGFFGGVNTTLAGVTAEFTSSSTQVENFDVSVQVGVAWAITAYDIYTGSSAVTLEAFTSAISGTFVEADGRVGSVSVTLEDFAPNFDGTNSTPENRTGSIVSDITPVNAASFSGTAIDPSAIEGVVSSTLSDFSIEIAGTYDSGTFTGTIPNQTLEDFAGAVTGRFFDANTNVGYMEASVLFTSNFDGQAIGDAVISSARVAGRNSKDAQKVASRRSREGAGVRRGRAKAK